MSWDTVSFKETPEPLLSGFVTVCAVGAGPAPTEDALAEAAAADAVAAAVAAFAAATCPRSA